MSDFVPQYPQRHLSPSPKLLEFSMVYDPETMVLSADMEVEIPGKNRCLGVRMQMDENVHSARFLDSAISALTQMYHALELYAHTQKNENT